MVSEAVQYFFRKGWNKDTELLKKLSFSEVRTSFTALDIILKLLLFCCLDFGSKIHYLIVFTIYCQISRSLSTTVLSSTRRVQQNTRGNLVDFLIETQSSLGAGLSCST